MATSFRRAPDFDRRADLVDATLDCIAELGIQGTTVRSITARAGVTNGLIRHHFASKDNLIVAAYRRTIEIITEPPLAVASSQGSPHDKMRRFIAASVSGPAADPRVLSLWAAFISQVHLNPDLAEVRREKYLACHDACEALIVDVLTSEGRNPSVSERQRLTTAVNALIDGLWLECCLGAKEIDENKQIEIGLQSVASLLGVTFF